MADRDRIAEVLARHAATPFAHRAVHGLGILHRHRESREIRLGLEGGADLEPVIVLYVDADPETRAPLGADLPERLDGIACVRVAEPRAEHTGGFEKFYRPLHAGHQISRVGLSHTSYKGTLGCFVVRRRDAPRLQADNQPDYIVSAAHVMHPNLKSTVAEATIDRRIHQPVSEVGFNHCADVSNDDVHGYNSGSKDVPGRKFRMAFDIGLAAIAPGTKATNYCHRIGPLNGLAEPVVGMHVTKHGRSTEKTWGRIVDVNASSHVLGPGMGLIRIRATDRPGNLSNGPFGDPGDSGAAIVADGGRVVGLPSLRIDRETALAVNAVAAFDALGIHLLTG